MTVKTTSKTKKLKRKQEEQLNQLKETLEAKERAQKDRLKKDEDSIVFDRDTDGQEQRLAEHCSRTAEQKELSRGDGF